MHLDSISGDGEAKVWLEPSIEVSKNHGVSAKQMAEVIALMEEHQHELTTTWRQHFCS